MRVNRRPSRARAPAFWRVPVGAKTTLPGSLVEMTVRVLPAHANRVAASVDAAAAAALRSGASAGECMAAIAVSPGPHAVRSRRSTLRGPARGDGGHHRGCPGDPVEVMRRSQPHCPPWTRAVVTAIVRAA